MVRTIMALRGRAVIRRDGEFPFCSFSRTRFAGRLNSSARPAMKTPIVEVRQQNLFVVAEFDGVFVDNIMRTRHNMINNKNCYVIDSDGDLWSFAFVRTDHTGIRKVVGALFRNISHDQYTYTKESNISVGRFREIIGPHQRDLDPDHSEMATALFESVGACNPSDPLRNHIHLLNL